MARGGRNAGEVALLRTELVRRVVGGDSPAAVAAALGVSRRHAYRLIRAWREAQRLSAREVRALVRFARDERAAEKEVSKPVRTL